jgi:hypothetical protein
LDDEEGGGVAVQGARVVSFFRHPIKGTIRVDSYSKAMEIASELEAKNYPLAKFWREIALQMEDAPGNNDDYSESSDSESSDSESEDF